MSTAAQTAVSDSTSLRTEAGQWGFIRKPSRLGVGKDLNRDNFKKMTNNSETSEETGRKRKRVNLSFDPELYKKGKEHAEDQLKSYSRYLEELVIEDFASNGSNAESDVEQILGRKIDDNNDLLRTIRERIEELIEIIQQIAKKFGRDNRFSAERIEEELRQSEEPMSIPDLEKRLPISHNDIEAGLRILEDEFVVDRIPSNNTDIDLPHWELKK